MTVENIGKLEAGDVVVKPTGIGSSGRRYLLYLGRIDGHEMFSEVFPVEQANLTEFTVVRSGRVNL